MENANIYKIGDIVSINNGITNDYFKCIIPVDTPEEFDENKWNAIDYKETIVRSLKWTGTQAEYDEDKEYIDDNYLVINIIKIIICFIWIISNNRFNKSIFN